VLQSSPAVPSISAAQSPASLPSEEPTDEATDEASEDPGDGEVADEPDTETMTSSQEQAVRKAEEYIEYTAFSRNSLIKQLEFEGFTRKEAEHGAKGAGL